MKQPRVNDFDPKATEKPLKSSMDNFPTIQSRPQEPSAEATSTGSTPGTIRTVVPGVLGIAKRKIKTRHPFDIYEDQAEALKKLSLEDRMRGGAGSQSAMVREALDDYIAKKKDH